MKVLRIIAVVFDFVLGALGLMGGYTAISAGKHADLDSEFQRS